MYEPDKLMRSVFCAKLRDLRVACGLSLREVAAMLGTTTVRLGEVERAMPDVLAVQPPTNTERAR